MTTRPDQPLEDVLDFQMQIQLCLLDCFLLRTRWSEYKSSDFYFGIRYMQAECQQWPRQWGFTLHQHATTYIEAQHPDLECCMWQACPWRTGGPRSCEVAWATTLVVIVVTIVYGKPKKLLAELWTMSLSLRRCVGLPKIVQADYQPWSP